MLEEVENRITYIELYHVYTTYRVQDSGGPRGTLGFRPFELWASFFSKYVRRL